MDFARLGLMVFPALKKLRRNLEEKCEARGWIKRRQAEIVLDAGINLRKLFILGEATDIFLQQRK